MSLLKRVFPYPLLAIALAAMWLVLNQSVAPFHVVVGLALGASLSRVMLRLDPEPPVIRRPRLILELTGVVLYDILVSNLRMIAIILRFGPGPRSGFVNIPLQLRNRYGLAALATIITSTPGTFWASVRQAQRRAHDPRARPPRAGLLGQDGQGALRAAPAGGLRMSQAALGYCLAAAQALLAVALFMCAYRLIRGPRAQDRVMALDALYMNGLLSIVMLGIRTGTQLYFEAALVIALTGFVSTSAVAKFLMRGEVIE